jgi:hypothetical protein
VPSSVDCNARHILQAAVRGCKYAVRNLLVIVGLHVWAATAAVHGWYALVHHAACGWFDGHLQLLLELVVIGAGNAVVNGVSLWCCTS